MTLLFADEDREHREKPYPHEISCEACRKARLCNYCGKKIRAGERCTNGRCKNCCAANCRHKV